MATVSDLARVSENLQYSYEKDHKDNFFSQDVDTFLAMCEEVEESDNGGAGYVVQVISRGGVNANPQYNLAGTGAPLRTQFIFQPVNIEWKATWTRDAMLAAETKGMKAMFDLAKEEIDIAQRHAKIELGKELGGRGWGSLAGIGTISGSNITLAQPDGSSTATVAALSNRFFEGQILVAADAEDSGDLRGSAPGDQLTVVTNDRSGTLVMSGAISGTAWAVGDYLSEYGYRNYAASSGKLCITGLEGWLDPNAAVSGDSFGGKSRYQRSDLQPMRFDVSGQANLALSTVAEQLIAADEYAFTNGLPAGNDTMIFVAPQQQRQLASTAQSGQIVQLTVERTNSKGATYTISYSAFMLQGMRGLIPVTASAFVRPTLGFWGPFKSKSYGFKLLYSGKMLMNINYGSDGLAFRLDPRGITDNSGNTVSGYRSEGFFRGQLKCAHPGNYLVIKNLNDTAV